MRTLLSNRVYGSPCAKKRGVGVCAFVLGLLGAANAWADCNDFLLQYGRFRGGASAHASPSRNGWNEGLSADNELAADFESTARGDQRLPAKCSGPGCSPRHLPQPKPVVSWQSPVREMLLLSAAPKTCPEGRFFVDVEVVATASQFTTDIFRPPR